VLSARDPADFGTALRRLVRSGFGVSLAAYGSAAPEHVARARALGIDAALLSLDPDWRSADALAFVA
jgi:hypothetical protein